MYMQTPDANVIVRLADRVFIPKDPLNRDYLAYLAWVDEGNTPELWTGIDGASEV